jgi:hypothetical protein
MVIFMKRSEAVLEALRTRRIEAVHRDAMDVLDEVADKL